MLMSFDAIFSPCRITYILGYIIVLCTQCHMIMIWNPSINLKAVRGRYPNSKRGGFSVSIVASYAALFVSGHFIRTLISLQGNWTSPLVARATEAVLIKGVHAWSCSSFFESTVTITFVVPSWQAGS